MRQALQHPDLGARAEAGNGRATLDIVIVPSGPDASSGAFLKVKDNLGAALTSKLRARTGLTVHTRGAAESDTDAILNIQIVHLNYVSAGARWMGGVMSGRATLETKVVLLDQRDARTLWNISTDAAFQPCSRSAWRQHDDTGRVVVRAAS